MSKEELEKEVYTLVKLLMQKIDYETQLTPEQKRQSSIAIAKDELKEFRDNLNKLVDESRHLVLYDPLFGKTINELYTALDNYERFMSEEIQAESIDEAPLERQQMIRKQQSVRNDFLKRIQDKYLKGEN